MQPASKKAKLLPLAEIAEAWAAHKANIEEEVQKANEALEQHIQKAERELQKQKANTFTHRVYAAFTEHAIGKGLPK